MSAHFGDRQWRKVKAKVKIMFVTTLCSAFKIMLIFLCKYKLVLYTQAIYYFQVI